jgi:hypothetical protein
MEDPLIVSGPRKRKENSWFVDNGDPGPLVRNKKVKLASNAAEKPSEKHIPRAQAAEHCHPSVQGLEDATLENSDESPIDVNGEEDEPLEESADEELGEYLMKVTRN